jgi:hypothetical protein
MHSSRRKSAGVPGDTPSAPALQEMNAEIRAQFLSNGAKRVHAKPADSEGRILSCRDAAPDAMKNPRGERATARVFAK